PWRPIVISLGVFTMLLGGIQALRETDLKRLLAFGTVSQLGFLTVVLGFGTRDAALAGLALLLGHALFKSALFLVVGIIDRQVGTRDVGELSGVGRQAPVLATFAIVAVASMAGVIPTIGFVAKEGALQAFFDAATAGSPWGIVALIGVVLGSIFTVAYGIRFVWGAFWTKRGLPRTEWRRPAAGIVLAPALLAGLTVVAGPAAPVLDAAFAPYAQTAPGEAAHLELWHGFGPALWLSLGTLLLGALVFVAATAMRFAEQDSTYRQKRLLPFTAPEVYNAVLRGIAK